MPNDERNAVDRSLATWTYWIAAAAVIIAILAAWRVLPLDRLIEGFADWMSALGIPGLAAFILIYAATTLAMGPAWSLSVAAGVAFGFWALPLVLGAATAGAAAGFAVARQMGRERVVPYIRRRPRLEAVDQAVRTHGFKAVLLLRLNPAVPFGAKSYLLGLTAVPARMYLAGTLLGIVPGSTFYVYLGALGHLAARDAPKDWLGWGLLVLGLLATAAVVVIIAREAQRRLREIGL